MKDVSNPTRHSRQTVYHKKRPSPHVVSTMRKQQQPLLRPLRYVVYKPLLNTLALRQRDIQLRREGVFLEEEYREEIQSYMHEMERDTMSLTTSMKQQPEIGWHMRPHLVDFLIEVHFAFRLRPETLYLTLNIIDRYVSRRVVYVKHYQLVGCVALWIAAKFEDAKERVPRVRVLAQICHATYDESAFIQMEGHILATIQWALGHPTAESWLRVLCCGHYIEDTKVQHVARFLMEITPFYRDFVQYPPSSIALGVLTLARYLCGKSRRISGETAECLDIVNHLDAHLTKHVNDLSQTLIKKYSYAFHSEAAPFVVQYYLKGGRFHRQPIAFPPMTPKVSAPVSVSTVTSYPVRVCYMTRRIVPCLLHCPKQYLSHDFVSFSRPASHSLDVVSLRPIALDSYPFLDACTTVMHPPLAHQFL